MDWSTFEVAEAMVHYIPSERDEPGAEPLYTDSIIPLDEQLRTYFRDRIAERLEARGLAVIDDDDRDATATKAAVAVIADDGALVESSKRIAIHLHAVQTGTNSSGLLAIISGKLDGKPCLAIMKLERQRGVRFEVNDVGGRKVVDLELLRNLTLTDKAKVFKTAVLFENDGSVEGYVADDQRTTSDGRQVASFFLSKFLGCKPKEPAAKLTYDFVKLTNDFINEDVSSPERQGKYQVALLAKMQDNSADISPARWAADNLDTDDRPKLLERLEEAGFAPAASFAKDTSLVKVERFRMVFKQGMVLVGNKDSLDNLVELPKDKTGDEPVKLNDSVEDLITGR
jgi:hypothetical protein